MELLRGAMCSDKELPVRVEAALAIQMMLTEQEKGMWKRIGQDLNLCDWLVHEN